MKDLTVDNFRTHLFIFNYSFYPNIAGLLDFENISDLRRVPPFFRLEYLSIETENLNLKLFLAHNGLRQFAQKDLYCSTTLTLM